MARTGWKRRRLARLGAVVGAAALLAALCTPGVLLAQSPPPVGEEPPPAPEPEAPAPRAPPGQPDESPDAGAPGGADVSADSAAAPPPAAPAPAKPLAVASGGSTVAMADFSFSPATITINQGATVTWTNAGPDEPHTATGSGFDTGQVAVGSSASATFSQTGDFSYVCSLHPDLMSGTVRVLASAAGQDDAAGTAPESPVPGSEAAAVAAPDAAGTASELPATGLVALPLALIGLGLLAAGARLRP